MKAYGKHLHHQPCHLHKIDPKGLQAVVAGWRSKSGCADGWDRPTFRKLPPIAITYLAQILDTCEEHGTFPEDTHYASVVLLPKAAKDLVTASAIVAAGQAVDPAPTALQQRPITLQSLLISMWSTHRYRALRGWFKRVVHSSCYGGPRTLSGI